MYSRRNRRTVCILFLTLISLAAPGCGFVDGARQRQRAAQLAAEEARAEAEHAEVAAHFAEASAKVALARSAEAAAGSGFAPITDKAPRQDQKWTRPFPVVGYRGDQARRVQVGAELLAKNFEAPGVAVGGHNPRCCIWIELIGEANPGGPGWVFLHEAGGSFLWATDAEQLIAAIEHLTELAKESPVEYGLPIGVTTSFRVTGR